MGYFTFCDFLPRPKIKINDNGIAEGVAKIARAGVQKYLINGKMVGVLRDESDVLTTASFFDNLPICVNHPINGEININNREKLTKGWGGQCEFKDGWLVTKIHLFAEDAIQAAQSSHQEFSNGYKAELIEEEGEWVDAGGLLGVIGQKYPYSYRQKILKGNHIALVPNGTARAGSQATFCDSQSPTGVIMEIENNVNDKSSCMKDMMSYVNNMAKECGYADFMEEDGMSFPKSMKDMMSKYKDAWMKNAKDSITDSAEWVRVEALKASENKVRELETKISLQSVKISELSEQVQGLTNDSYIVDKFTARCEAYKLVAPYVAMEFDPTLSETDWYKKALNNKNIITDNMSDEEIKSGFNVLVQLFKPEEKAETKTTVTDDLAELRAAKTSEKKIVLPQHRAIKTIV